MGFLKAKPKPKQELRQCDYTEAELETDEGGEISGVIVTCPECQRQAEAI